MQISCDFSDPCADSPISSPLAFKHSNRLLSGVDGGLTVQISRKAFVAYSYRLYPGSDYRECFTRVGKEFGIEFIYADTQTGNEHLLEKIKQMIRESTFSIFDVSDWNANVTLELGYAIGIGHPFFIVIDPSRAPGTIAEAPADLRGLDRIQYASVATLESGLSRLMRQLFGRSGPLTPSLGEVIHYHVFDSFDQLLKERLFAPDRDSTAVILPDGRVQPLDTEIIIRELPQHVQRIPPDPFNPSAPVGFWVTDTPGNLLGAALGLLVAIELGLVLLVRGAAPVAASALFFTALTVVWYLGARHKRRAFERSTPYSVTYHRPDAKPLGPYFVWNFSEPADPDDPHNPARDGDARAVRVELRWRSPRQPPLPD